MATPNETNSGPSGESATLLHTALFKQVSSEEAEELPSAPPRKKAGPARPRDTHIQQ